MMTARVVATSLVALAACIVCAPQSAQCLQRTYFIGAEQVTWSYAPAGRDVMFDKPLPRLAPAQLGWTYRKLVYRAFTDASFSRRSPIVPHDAYLGTVGPVIHAAVGDTVSVTFKNLTGVRVGFQPQGGLDGPTSEPLAPGASQSYRYRVPESSGPGPMDVSSTLWTYRPAGADFVATDDDGLVGPIVITRRGAALANGAPADVDREIFAVFSMSLESRSPLFKDDLSDPRLNPRRITGNAATVLNDNLFGSINGYSFGNMPTITLGTGQRVRWYVFTTSNSFDFHDPTWNGETVVVAGHRTDTAGMTPSGTSIADMTPDNPGTWMLWCAQNAFLDLGMYARYDVRP